jgi:hypothetical protein
MNKEILEFMHQAGLSRGAVERVGEMLPGDDEELANWIDEAIHESDPLAFMLLVYAAFVKGRPVDAKHLIGGAKVAGGPAYLVAMMFGMQGEVPECLLEGMKNTAIHNETAATALFAAAIWCDENRGGVYPDGLLTEARTVARRVKMVPAVDIFLISIAEHLHDPVLHGIMRKNYSIIPEDQWKKLATGSLPGARDGIRGYRTPILQLLPVEPYFPLDPTQTVRRSVERIGRNDPCPCGSGKKYKNCHQEEDRTRLQQSSGVSGHTLREVNASPARHLTLERLQKYAPVELARMDPLEVPRHLLTEFFVRLSLFNLDRAAEFIERIIEKSGFEDDLEDSWFFIMFHAARTWRKDIGDWMMRLRPDVPEEEVRLSQRMLLAQDDHAKSLRLIEEAAVKALKSEDPADASDLAYAVGFSKFGGLAVFLFRSILMLGQTKDINQGYDLMMSIRERLNLPPDDPIHELLEARRDKALEETEAALRETKEKFEAKRREARELKDSLEQIHKDIARRERAWAAEAAAAAPGKGEGEERLREMRQKVKNLEASLKEKNAETNVLQRQLEEAEANVEALRERAQQAGTTGAHDAESDHEDDLLLPQDAEGNHPVRLIEFPRSFHDRLNEFPHHVARGTMVMLGRLAGGDSAAFAGAKRLKSRPNVVRQRIGIDFRLLFRLLPDRIQVIDLIPRQDFERKIKTLT